MAIETQAHARSASLYGSLEDFAWPPIRPVAALMAGFMLVGVYAGWQFGYFWTSKGFSIRLLLFILSLAFVIRGGGKYLLDRVQHREF